MCAAILPDLNRFAGALNILARYFSGYAYELEPPDFHACFEAYIGGRWLIFDATLIGRISMDWSGLGTA